METNALYPLIMDGAISVIRIILYVVFAVLLIPWVKNFAIPWLKEKQLYGIVQRLVRAAEKMGDAGIISKEDKLNYVAGLLERYGVVVTPEVRALIESAVGTLDDEMAKNIAAVVKEFETAAGHETAVELVKRSQEHAPEKTDEAIRNIIQTGAEALANQDDV